MIHCHIYLMLNIINLLKKSQTVNISEKRGDTVDIYKRNIPLNKEWYNIVYSFDKNPIRFYPAVHNLLFKFLKMHFNMYNEDLEKRDKSREHRKIKRSLLNNKIWVSTPEVKHFNRKAIITLYIYNRLYGQCKKQLKLLGFTWGPVISEISNRDRTTIKPFGKDKKSIIVVKEIKKQKSPIYILGKEKKSDNIKNFYLKIIKWLKWDKLNKVEQYRDVLVNNLNLIKFDHYNYLINLFKKELIYIKLRQKILFNKFKFNEIYLTLLKDLFETIYKKKVEFNIVVLKHRYLSSSIMAQMATIKVLDKKNRGQARRPISDIIKYNSIPNLSGKKVQRETRMTIGVQNEIYSKYKGDDKSDLLNKFLLINKTSKTWSSKYIDNFVMQNTENKSVAGLFIKISGRLTKRYKAQRSISVLRYRGTLKNVYSAHKGYSSMLSRGYGNINLDKTMINSKLRIGAFGLTGWVASC